MQHTEEQLNRYILNFKGYLEELSSSTTNVFSNALLLSESK